MEFSILSRVVEVHESLPEQVIDWGVQLVHAPSVWKETRGEGIRVAILDTGVWMNHPDLQANLKKARNFSTSNPENVMDWQGHGTHVAGIIAGCDNDIGIVGVAPMAELYIAKVLTDSGKGGVRPIIDAIEWAIEEEVDIISMSLGSSKEPGSELHEAIKRARDAGIILVAASGNENGYMGWPSLYPEVISVGAIGPSMEHARFSNYGKELNVVAPGVDILSTYLRNGYARLSGTSMATPIVSGVVALIQAYARKRGIKATPEVIVQMMHDHSVDLGDEGHDELFGDGLVDVSRLLQCEHVFSSGHQ